MEYSSLDFKCGLECHQQLETRKLFCNCPSLVNDPLPPTYRIQRVLRAVAGEAGGVDQAAAFETQKHLTFIYEGRNTSSCLVELDEEPPHTINQEAVEIALQVAFLLEATPVDEVQVMRKTVVDGSNVSGFQRTALIATDGVLRTSQGDVHVPSICLEEEAAKRVHGTEQTVTFRLDRLGVPLIEIGTGPDIKSPEHAKEVAALLGMVLRSTGKAKRGIGTIRQDINLSIKGRARVELKGFQDLRSIPKVIEVEVARLLALKGKHQPEVRKVNEDLTTTFLRPMPGASRMYPETDIETIPLPEGVLSKIPRPALLTEKAKHYEAQYRLPSDLAMELVDSELPFDKLVKRFKNVDAAFIAHTLLEMPKEIKARYEVETSGLEEKDFDQALGYLNAGKVAKEAVIELLAQMAKGEQPDLARYKTLSDAEIKRVLQAIIRKNKGASVNALMGEAMKDLRGRVDGRRIMDFLRQLQGSS